MCGIAGIHNLGEHEPVAESELAVMLGMLRHRGPDQFGIYHSPSIGLGSARLSIIDLKTGDQPISNEDETVWIVYNGEVFNHPELRRDLIARGHRFKTQSDTEVVVHLYEEHGPGCVELLNGQFAFALWDGRPSRDNTRLFLARDRVGILPLFYTVQADRLLFASEIKALLAHSDVGASLDPVALAQIFTLWTTISPRTPFAGISELPPGHTMLVDGGRITVQQYWAPRFDEDRIGRIEEYADGFRDLLDDATRIRLRADVPVGSYLSGGLDSSAVTALTKRHIADRLETFSVTFDDPAFDERSHQESVVDTLGTRHHYVRCGAADIAKVFPDVVWHMESPVLRTAPAPMFLLSGLVHERGLKVVLTGEGADEFLAGYNIFRETKVRRFWAREPDSRIRPLLLNKLYAYVPGLSSTPGFTEAFFRRGLTQTDRLDYSHSIRWSNTAPLRRLLSGDMQAEAEAEDPVAEVLEHLSLHPEFAGWSPVAKAQYLEVWLFMSGYLLSSQGDRMLMAHSVEGRFPYLDHRVIEYAGHIPAHIKIRGLNEKFVLKQAMSGLLPDAVVSRPKQPYRAPILQVFLAPDAPEYVANLVGPAAVADAAVFDPGAVERLMKKARSGGPLGERDAMALTGVISTQLLHQHFVSGSIYCRPLAPGEMKVSRGPSADIGKG